MADAALAYADRGYAVYFATIEPSVTFYSGEGRETMLQLLQKRKNSVRVGSIKAGREFEFGTPEYVVYTYKQLLLQNVPAGVPIILSDDKSVWAAAASLHNTYPIVGVLHADDNAYYQLAKAYHKVTDVFASVSDRITRTVQTRSPEIPESKIFTIPCGINMPAPSTRKEQSDVLQLMYAGRIAEFQKRAGDLLKIAELLHKKNRAFHWNIIGDGGAFKVALEQQFADAGLKEMVTFKGWLSQGEVHEYMVASDVLVLASDFEGMPVAMMEGLASGCGFVGTRVSGIEDYEQHPLAKDCFGVFEVGDIESAVKKIQQIAAVPLQTRQQSARQLAVSQFTMDICLDRYDAAIATISSRAYQPGSASISPVAALKSRFVAMARGYKMKSQKS